MSNGGTAPGWYPDPSGSGMQRYFDGNAWTAHTAPMTPPPPGWGAPPWKGGRFGRPQYGPGSLAEPGSRLGARLLDALVTLPVFVVVIATTIAVVAPHFGPLFPNDNPNSNATVPTPGFVWLQVTIFGASLFCGLLFLVYEAVATGRYGRTLGKRWMHIRPVTLAGEPVGWGRSFGRAATYTVAGYLGWLGIIDYLWCLWDPDAQCLHDKVAGTLVVRD